MLFVHRGGERQQTAAGSINELDLVAKAADPTSGWRVADEADTPTDGAGRLVKHRPPRPAPVSGQEVSDG